MFSLKINSGFLIFFFFDFQADNKLDQFVRARSCFVSIWHCDLCTCTAYRLLFFLTEEKTKHSLQQWLCRLKSSYQQCRLSIVGN